MLLAEWLPVDRLNAGGFGVTFDLFFFRISK